MNTKPKAAERDFIAFFVVIFGAMLFVLFAVVIFPLLLLSFFSLSKILFVELLFGITIVDAIITAFIAQREYDTSELSAMKTSLKLVAVIGILPLIVYGPVLIVRWNPKDLMNILGIFVWLFVIGLISYFVLKRSSLKKIYS